MAGDGLDFRYNTINRWDHLLHVVEILDVVVLMRLDPNEPELPSDVGLLGLLGERLRPDPRRRQLVPVLLLQTVDEVPDLGLDQPEPLDGRLRRLLRLWRLVGRRHHDEKMVVLVKYVTSLE